LANTVSADTVESLKQKHGEELQGLRAQAARAQELETELAKARGTESSLRLEFDHQLAKEKGILSAKYDSEVDELCASLESKVEGRDAEINELKSLKSLIVSSMTMKSAFGTLGTARSSPACWGLSTLFTVNLPLCFPASALLRCFLIL
jgi:hypothetical protein